MLKCQLLLINHQLLTLKLKLIRIRNQPILLIIKLKRILLLILNQNHWYSTLIISIMILWSMINNKNNN